jgi:hypothetical protein
MELPSWLEIALVAVQIFAVGLFFWLIWPLVKAEKWKEKFIHNKQALSILIVFVLIFVFVYGMMALFDWLYPIETLK